MQKRNQRRGSSLLGALKRGVNFEVARTLQNKIQAATVDIHKRLCRRAIDKVRAMRRNAVNPAKIQRYLSNWATWWHSVVKLDKEKLIRTWVCNATRYQPDAAWLGRGLLIGSSSSKVVVNTAVVFTNQNSGGMLSL